MTKDEQKAVQVAMKLAYGDAAPFSEFKEKKQEHCCSFCKHAIGLFGDWTKIRCKHYSEVKSRDSICPQYSWQYA